MFLLNAVSKDKVNMFFLYLISFFPSKKGDIIRFSLSFDASIGSVKINSKSLFSCFVDLLIGMDDIKSGGIVSL